MTVVRVSDIEEVIREMRGVEGAKVVVDSSGSLQEVHVLVHGARNPKQVVRDIESALMAKYNLRIDHKKVSVALSGNDDERPVNPSINPTKEDISPRLGLKDLSITMGGTQFEARVRLNFGENIYEGFASGQNVQQNRFRILSKATLLAVESVLNAPGLFLVEETTQVRLPGDRDAINVVVCLMSRYGEEHLLGAALVKQDVSRAVILATLDALNRRFSLLAREFKPRQDAENLNLQDSIPTSDDPDLLEESARSIIIS